MSRTLAWVAAMLLAGTVAGGAMAQQPKSPPRLATDLVDQAVSIANGIPAGGARADVLIDAAELLVTYDPVKALGAACRASADLGAPSREQRRRVEAVLLAAGATVPAARVVSSAWGGQAMGAGCERLFALSAESGRALADSLPFSPAERIDCVISATRAMIGSAPAGDEAAAAMRSSAKQLAAALLAEVGLVEEPPSALVRRAVSAALEADPTLAPGLVAGPEPIRSAAAEHVCAHATDAKEALRAAPAVAQSDRRAGALAAAMAGVTDPEGKAQLVVEAERTAALIEDPGSQADALARLAAASAGTAESAKAAAQARVAALSVAEYRARVRALAGVAAHVAEVAPDVATLCLRDARAVVRTVREAGMRAQALREIGCGIAPGMPESALEIADELGKARLQSRVDVLSAVASCSSPRWAATAMSGLVAAVAALDASPGAKLAILRAVPAPSTTVAQSETPVPAKEAPPGKALGRKDEGPTAEERVNASRPGFVVTTRSGGSRSARGAKSPTEGGGTPESPKPAKPEPEPTPTTKKPAEPTDVGTAYASVRDAIRRLRLPYADSLPIGEERVTAYLDAFGDVEAARGETRRHALREALNTALKIDPTLGWIDAVCAAGSPDDREALVEQAKTTIDPERRARCLLALGAESDAVAAMDQIRDPWRKVEFRAEMCEQGSLAPAVGLLAGGSALPPGDQRDRIVLRAVDALLRGGAADGLTEALALRELVLGPDARGCTELAIAAELLRGGKTEDGQRGLAQAGKLVPVDSRTDAFLRRLAVAQHLGGVSGVATARMVVDDAARAAALLEIGQIELTRQTAAPQPGAGGGAPGP